MFKLKSYTIIEVLLSMIITGFLVVLGYMFLNSVNARYQAYVNLKEELMNYSEFKNVFKRDFFLARSIKINNKEVFFFDEGRIIKYKFEDIVQRNNGYFKNDTFLLRVDKLKPVFFDSIKKEKIKGILLETKMDGDDLKFVFEKELEASMFVNKFFNNEDYNKKNK